MDFSTFNRDKFQIPELTLIFLGITDHFLESQVQPSTEIIMKGQFLFLERNEKMPKRKIQIKAQT